MGQSTDAYLFYGIDFGEDHADKMFELMMEHGPYDHGHVVVSKHCSDSAPMFFVCIRWSYYRAYRGYPEEFDPAGLVKLDREWMNTTLRRFCEDHGLPYEEPQWLLASYWET